MLFSKEDASHSVHLHTREINVLRLQINEVVNVLLESYTGGGFQQSS
jgi:hypothetical protein